ncbi:MAG: AMP-binding protein [Candidatus Cloacimonadota bacterium]|nr:AMP-binding protein [Candidatus Cloacimonadota bacterium]
MDDLKKLTLKSLLNYSAKKYSDKPALSFVSGTPISYSELRESVQELSKFLHHHGIIVGDKVAILSENNPNWGIAYFAITTMGAIAVPILPDFHVTEVHHILRHSNCKAIFVSEKYYEKIEDFRSDTLSSIILINDFSLIPLETSKVVLKKLILEGSKEIAKIKEAALRLTKIISPEVQEDDIAVIIYTSGTTGHSKGVVLTHKNIVFDAIATLKIQNITTDDRLLSILPLPHTYECTIGFIVPLIRGACIYYLEKPPTARVLLPAMQKIKPTMILTVPLIIEKIFKTKISPNFTHNTIIRKLYHFPPIRKILHKLAGKKLMKSFGGKLRFFGIGGALLSPEVEKFLREAKFPYAIGYGLTETSPLIAGSSAEMTKYRSTGYVIPGVEVQIINQNKQTGEGEIVVKGDNVMKEYYKDPEGTANVFTKDGWFKTGDLGLLKRNKYLYIKGRLKNIIVGPSGENIYPEEIESAINECNYVFESLVFQKQEKLMVRVYLNYEEIDREFAHHKFTETQLKKKISEILNNIRTDVNAKVSSFSKIYNIIEQQEPFKKTPTQKIKRYLYV